MKKVLGLDIGTTSIGWAYIHEAENEDEETSILKLGVRIVPITTDEENDFQKGKSISLNADRTLKRGARRNLDRFHLRRKALVEILKEYNFITDNTKLSEDGKETFYNYKIRAKAAKEQISKEDFARVLLMINKKRGYKSNRKAKGEEEGTAINGMETAKVLYENNMTPGQYVYSEILLKGKSFIPDFYRSDLQNELDKIWEFQKQFYPEILTDEFKKQIENKRKLVTSKIFLGKYKIYTAENKGTRDAVKLQTYKWRSDALNKQLTKEELAYVITEINNNINSSSGYLGAISDRSKALYFNKETVGEYLYKQLLNNRHTRLKNQVFYRQDYLDEFEKIWETQKQYYPELTDELKKEIRDVIIFYQRPLKSQKGLLSFCEFESWEEEYKDAETGETKKRRVGHKVIPKSSPLFQEFKIWQILNNIELRNTSTGEYGPLTQEIKEEVFNSLNIVAKLPNKDFLKLVVDNSSEFEINYKEGIEGNRTIAELYKAFQKILEYEGVELDYKKMNAEEIKEAIKAKFTELGINTEILEFNSNLVGNNFDKQPLMQLWHLLYSVEEEENLIKKITEKFGFKKEYAKLIAAVPLQADYGNLSARAIRKILPYLKAGNDYDAACMLAGYNHSHSLTKEEIEEKELQDKLELIPKNSLRNPIVEKILNQMVNVVNAIIDDETLGKPDEVRIELARELKKSADEREKMSRNISKATRENEEIRKTLREDFGITKVTRNDIIRYKLWKELESYGYKTIYTNTYYIPKEKLFSKEFDIEHIIPQAKLFDDSFSNKTLALRQINIEKGNETAYDYLKNKLSAEEFEQYLARIRRMLKDGKISRAKYNKLMMKSSEIPDDFIERDLRNSQYIAKKAKQMLLNVFKTVNTTSGSITARLREDWQLINVMKEINLPKYQKLGLVEQIQGKNGRPEYIIKDWSKRNDHRHHAMDALTVAFTTHSHVQYLNYMNARHNEKHKKYHDVYGIEQKYLYRNEKGKLLFKPPIPIEELRSETKKHLENILVSFKAKNKVVTRNKNRIKVDGKNNYKEKIELTPRGQLHKETVYGSIKQYKTKIEKVGAKFDLNKIELVANKKYREALKERLSEFNNNPAKAFGGKNALNKNPLYIKNGSETVPDKVKLVWFETQYTIRKEISPDLKINKVIDKGIKAVLQKRLNEFGGDSKKAFINLDENPIWLNKKKGVKIKSVIITGVNNVVAIHTKKDHNGKPILDNKGNEQPVDFVSTGNNHHVAIYRDENGNLQEEVVSFFEAVARVNAGLPVIDKNKEGLEFLFTMKQNEYFVFPDENFNPNEIDLLNPDNAKIISPHLFRVQKISTKNYVFNHHLETKAVDGDLLKNRKEFAGILYNFIWNTSKLNGIVKVRINHIGKIVKVGEY